MKYTLYRERVSYQNNDFFPEIRMFRYDIDNFHLYIPRINIVLQRYLMYALFKS